MEMVKKITRGFFNFVSVIAFIWGFGLIIASINTPGQYRMFSSSAVQATQVYSEAIMYALQGCGLILFALFIYLNMHFSSQAGIDEDQLEKLTQNTSRTNAILIRLTKTLSEQ